MQIVANIYLALCVLPLPFFIFYGDPYNIPEFVVVIFAIFSTPLRLILLPLASIPTSVLPEDLVDTDGISWLVLAITYVLFVGVISLGTYLVYKFFNRKKPSKS